jgi:flavin reductase (DIM6/NTAB) family NADH-FMN oxidoreductase RutF
MSSIAAQRTFDPAQFRHVIGHFMSGVALITTHHDERDHGMTASAVSSLSLEPPMLTVCLHRNSPTQEAIYESGAFGLSILREGQDEIASRFARPNPDKFAGLRVVRGPLGQPLLEESLATIECEVDEAVVGGTHRVFLARVVHAEVGQGAPLAYYRGRFGHLEIAADDEALARVRRAILSRAIPRERRLDIEELAAMVEAPAHSVEFALARLLSEQLVTRDPSGYRQVPLDVRRVDDAFATKLILDLGAAELASPSEAELDRLVALARATAPPADVETLVERNEDFHEAAIALAGNDALLRAYRQLRLPAILSHVLWRDTTAAAELAEEHVRIAEALRRRDVPAARELITLHNARGAESHRRAILAAGGRL